MKKLKILTAPIAGVTDYSYRKILKEFSPDVMYTEMVSANAIVMQNDKTINNILKLVGGDSVQIFGKEIDIMCRAAKFVEDLGVKHIDINAGCPVNKVVKTGGGAALMGDLDHIDRLMQRLKESVNVTLSIKTRIGYKGVRNSLNIAKLAEKNGFSYITIHGRTREQMYAGVANWDEIKMVKDNVNIDVIGNGDIFTGYDAIEKANYSNVDGVMIARGMFSYPWLITEIKEMLEFGEIKTKVTLDMKIDMAKRHLMSMIEEKGIQKGIQEMRKHMCWYIKGIKNSTKLKEKMNKMENIDEILDTLESLKME
ncbi:MAG: tRNA dihydrouridine synthase DusB [Fusobacteria bacterium]|nr:tRNA dihydrouridine synthase DusB [Fusobacteriota bacterium]